MIRIITSLLAVPADAAPRGAVHRRIGEAKNPGPVSPCERARIACLDDSDFEAPEDDMSNGSPFLTDPFLTDSDTEYCNTPVNLDDAASSDADSDGAWGLPKTVLNTWAEAKVNGDTKWSVPMPVPVLRPVLAQLKFRVISPAARGFKEPSLAMLSPRGAPAQDTTGNVLRRRPRPLSAFATSSTGTATA